MNRRELHHTLRQYEQLLHVSTRVTYDKLIARGGLVCIFRGTSGDQVTGSSLGEIVFFAW